jgi:hypothetical protein
MNRSSPHDPAFRLLRGALLRRRLQRFDPRVRGEIVLLALVINGFLFWQARVPLDGARHAHGPLAVARILAGVLLAIAIGTSAVIATRHARRLRGALPGPEWLPLPLPPAAIVDHHAWESRLIAGAGVALAPAFLAAAHGLLPAWTIGAIGVVFLVVLWVLAHAATALATEIVRRVPRFARTREPLLDLLAESQAAPARAHVRPAQWRSVPAWVALLGKDGRLARRPTAARQRLVAPVLFGLVACMVWLLPIDPPLARLLAFGAGLVTAATLAEFLIELAGADAVAILRTLPIGALAVWLSRACWVALGAIVLVAAESASARPIAGPALAVLLIWLAGAFVAIGLLGVHYGMTLGSNAAAAQRFLTLALGISMAASLMIPLLGWIVLLALVIHSARRVPRWARIEDER